MSLPDKTIVQVDQPADALPSGTIVAQRYRIERVLGQGGMGIVYLAVHLSLKKPVALKMLLPHLAGRPEFVGRFHREAEALAQLNHRHIVGVSDFGGDAGRYYLVFEYVEGGTLEALFLDRGPGQFTTDDVARRLTEILQGLEHAHRAGIIHRDLKPANILLEKTGEAKISDFGLARVIGDEAHRALIAQTQSSIAVGSGATSGYAGTADFMAPEVKVLQPADERSDLYAVGVMAYWMLTGRRPTAMAAAVSRAAKARRLPAEWDRLIGRALAEEPADRFQSATEMLAALKVARASRPRRSAWAAVGIGVVAVGGVTGITFGIRHRVVVHRNSMPVTVAASTNSSVPLPHDVLLRHAPNGSEISIAGQPFTPLSGGEARVRLPGGGAEVVVRAPQHHAWRGHLGGPGEPATVDVALEPLVAHPVAIGGLPRGAEVDIGGAKFTADADGRVIAPLLPGEVAISASAPRYQPFSRTLTLAEGQAELTVAMERIPPPKEVALPLGDVVSLRLLRVEPGGFVAGAAADELGRQPSDEPQRPVHIERAYYLGVYEVTQGEYGAVMHANPSASRSLRDPRRPVEQVGWAMLRAPDGFLDRLNRRLKELGLPFTADLPTEHEWEYACRAGAKTALYDGSALTNPNADAALDALAVYRQQGNAPERVGSRRPNAWGFYDLLGNVAEWTRDEPVLRGGNWRVGAAHCRAASRMATAADARPTDTMGFRLVLRPTDE